MSSDLHATLAEMAAQVEEIEKRAAALVEGRTVRVIKDFRDQPYGRSKPNLKGKPFRVAALFLAPVPVLWLATESGRVLGAGIELAGVEFVEAGNKEPTP
jgi:hypothetical protein